MRVSYTISAKNPERGNVLVDPGIDGRIILTRILNE
jgi:hypothetical protein